jgi:hypothetical protein
MPIWRDTGDPEICNTDTSITQGALMPMPANPPKNPASPFASFGGHHVGVRVPDYNAAKAW